MTEARNHSSSADAFTKAPRSAAPGKPAATRFASLFPRGIPNEFVLSRPNLLRRRSCAAGEGQLQTRDAFSNKWARIDYQSQDFEKIVSSHKEWFLELYGFSSEAELARALRSSPVILDAGTGMGHKAAWFAELASDSLVLAADISDSVEVAAQHFRQIPNLVFLQCDIGDLSLFDSGLFDYVVCDQVIHHTADPAATFRELVRVAKPAGRLSVYVYRKKALPRELLDDHFRELSRSLTDSQLMDLSGQLTQLGRLLSGIDEELDFPAVPLLGIEGGKMSVQRFLYWNFLKCFWNEELGENTSTLANYDWYAPCQATRYSEEEFRAWIDEARLDVLHFHELPSSYSATLRTPGSEISARP